MLKLIYVVNNAICSKYTSGQIEQNDKTTLYRQLRYVVVSTLFGQIGQNNINSLCHQLGYFDISNFRG